MKRTRENTTGMDFFNMANCLLLLSHGVEAKQSNLSSPEALFECKTCNRQFPSFQALGGHRASHKRPKLESLAKAPVDFLTLGNKPKVHECSICGLQFSLGQALGGHMRRHRSELSTLNDVVAKVPVHDLNMTPLENDLKVLFGKMAPKVDALFV